MKEEPREKVQSWIEGNFKKGEVKQEDWSMLPGGVILRDMKGGEAFVWWDLWGGKVQFKIKEEKS